MSFAISLPLTGLAGWNLLTRTEARQSAAFERQGSVQRDAAYFRARIGSITTAEALVNDRRLMRISLEAFGLEADLNAKAFIRKVLESPTLSADSLAAKLVDPRYRELSAAFGFGDFSVPRTVLSDFADGIMQRWKERRFEAAVGQANNDFRLAMNARRELAVLAAAGSGENTKWLRILGNAPLWQVVRQALNLPASFGSLDLDQQLTGLKARANAVFGDSNVSQFRDGAKLERLIQRFLVTSSLSGQAIGGVSAPNSPALALLQQSRLMGRL
jgi:hypothetical protein